MKSDRLFLFRYHSVIEVYNKIVRLKMQAEDGKMRETDVADTETNRLEKIERLILRNQMFLVFPYLNFGKSS